MQGFDSDEDEDIVSAGDSELDELERSRARRELRTAGYDDEEIKWAGDARHELKGYSAEELAEKIREVNAALEPLRDEDAAECDRKLFLLKHLHDLEGEFKKVIELSVDVQQEQDAGRRAINAKYCGFDTVSQCAIAFDQAICEAAKFTRAEKSVFARQGEGQVEIAKVLGKTQQAVSKSMTAADRKYRAAQRIIGGPHEGLFFQLMHFADTGGLSEWGKAYVREHGELPARCHRCPQAAIPRASISREQTPQPAPEKRCTVCHDTCAAWRDRCPTCGGELAIARRSKVPKTQ